VIRDTERLRFGYTAVHLSELAAVEFRWRLLGHDDEWQVSSEAPTEVQLSGLHGSHSVLEGGSAQRPGIADHGGGTPPDRLLVDHRAHRTGDACRAPSVPYGGVRDPVHEDRRVAADDAAGLVADEDVPVPDEHAVERPQERPAAASSPRRAEPLAEQRSGESESRLRHVDFVQ